jgi:hypothetical protein
MKSRQFFIYVWRINAIVILMAGILASATIAATAVGLLWQLTRTRQVSDVVNVSKNPANQDPVKAKTEVGTFTTVAGTVFVKAPLYLIQEYEYLSGSKESNSIQNYVFFDTTKKTSTWLRPENKGLILSKNAFPELIDSTFEAGKAPTTAYVYLLAEQDTNNDQRIDRDDQKKIAISDPSGGRFKVLIEQVDRFNGVTAIKDQADRISVLYVANQKLKASEVDLRSQTVLNTTELTAQP